MSKLKRPESGKTVTSDNLAGFPKATITQLEEALEERVSSRRSERADTYPIDRDRRSNDRRKKVKDSWLCSGDQEEITEQDPWLCTGDSEHSSEGAAS